MNSFDLMENDASMEIRKNADSHKPLGKDRQKAGDLFHTFPRSWQYFVLKLWKEEELVGEWNRESSARLRKENPRPGYVVWATRIHEQRVRQLPMNQLSCVSIDPRISD
jgi:hypothetical protein